MADATLNAEGLSCPLPILRVKKALKDMRTGDVLMVTATDPGAPADMSAFCRQTGNELLVSGREGDIYRFEIRLA